MMMEHALWCHLTGIKPQVVHVIRNSNTWADQLADGNLDGFDPEKRIKLPEPHWLVCE